MWTYRGSTAGQMDEVRPWRPDLDDGSQKANGQFRRLASRTKTYMDGVLSNKYLQCALIPKSLVWVCANFEDFYKEN